MAVHVAVALVFLQISHEKLLDVPETVQVEIREQARKMGRGNKGHNRKAYTLQSIIPKFKGTLGVSSDLTGSGSGEDDLHSGWGSGGADFERIADNMFYEGIREKVEGLLYYPPVLARHNISGVVKSRLVVSGTSGQCDFARTKIDGAHPYLAIYTMSLLKKLCGFNLAQGLPKRKWVVMDLAFDFEISERPIDELKFRNFTVGNVLAFHRGVQKSVAEWHLGPIQGIWFLPVVNVDIGWIGERWDSWVKGRDVYEQFREI